VAGGKTVINGIFCIQVIKDFVHYTKWSGEYLNHDKAKVEAPENEVDPFGQGTIYTLVMYLHLLQRIIDTI